MTSNFGGTYENLSFHRMLAESPVKSQSLDRPDQGFLAWEHALVARCQAWPLPPWLDRALKAFVRVGDGWAWALVALVLYLNLPWAHFKPVVGQALLAVAICLPTYWAVKLGFRRRRPFDGKPNIAAHVPPMDKYSFPSGHVMNNLAVAMTLVAHTPSFLPLALSVPIALGLLRIRYGVHFLTDIAAGAALGALSSLGAGWLFPRLFT